MGLPVLTNTQKAFRLGEKVNVPTVPKHGCVDRIRTPWGSFYKHVFPDPYGCQFRRSGVGVGGGGPGNLGLLRELCMHSGHQRQMVLGMESEDLDQIPALPRSFTHSGFQQDLYLLALNMSSTHRKTGCFQALDTLVM